ncbi:tripartite tricarboxylate transporter TctB family protein [Ancylobacter sp. 6x-1]|uniref:Tripartite tricarboxylate transporter TctB family protein n=1 Tax=Ancylobacter crimeensis TaxID=2579147 RepID=A0ABT0DAA7_9HYPH|nr:tripartite tricarboxylate transporter TctB family protein [Ancylobacter crimeensis]MCK0196839.1 tripartite tricarboxylate transporter TctB family protein [Ancylobacter crimeensis]
MERFVRNPKDVGAGILLIGLAAMFGILSLDLPMGSAVRMGPGYFPLVLSGILGVLGLIVFIGGLRFADEGEPIRLAALPWRGLVLVTLAVVVFGVGIRPLGLGPAMGLAVFISAMASRRFHLASALAMTGLMVLFAWAVFIKGLGLPLPMLGPLLGGY